MRKFVVHQLDLFIRYVKNFHSIGLISSFIRKPRKDFQKIFQFCHIYYFFMVISELVFCLLIRNFSKEICSVTISRTTKSSFVWTTFCKTINGQKSDLFSVYAEIEMRTEKQKILATYVSLCLPEYIFVNF